MRFLLDTSALIAHYRQEPGWARVQALFEEGASEVLAASVSLTEFGRRLRELGASDEEARATIEDYRELLDETVPIDGTVALTAFDIGCALSERLPLADALIAAAARERGACLVVSREAVYPPPPGEGGSRAPGGGRERGPSQSFPSRPRDADVHPLPGERGAEPRSLTCRFQWRGSRPLPLVGQMSYIVMRADLRRLGPDPVGEGGVARPLP